MAKQQFPYQNTSLKNLPGERWKDIPDFEGLYQVSSFGRIKSLERTCATRWDTPRKVPECIRRSHLDVKYNRTIHVPLYTLVITLYRDKQPYYFSVGRLVYCVFVRPFDMEDHTIYIAYKDKDGRNLRSANLFASGIKELKLESFATGRSVSHLTVLSKPVTQFGPDGRPLRHFPSMYKAGKLTGFNSRNIAAVASGENNDHMYKGYFWKTGMHRRPLALQKITRGKFPDQIHIDLAKRLRISKKQQTNPPACINLSLENMNGERWKAVPGYEILYHISNRGRVKALKKITSGKQQRWMPEQIKRLTVDFRMNSNGEEVPGSLLVMFARDGVKSTVSVARLVYYLFVKPFELADTSYRIYYKDNDPLNANHKNLFLRHAGWSFAPEKKLTK